MNNSFQEKLNTAIQLSNAGNQEGAISLLLQCKQEQIETDYVNLNLANCYIKNNDDNLAVKYLNEVLANNPQDEKTLLNLNQLALGIYRFDLALRACEMAEKAAPESVNVLAALIQAKKEARNRKGIRKLCKRMIAIIPDNSWSYSQIGYDYLTSGKFSKAQKAFKEAIFRDPHSSFMYSGLVKATKFDQIPKALLEKIDDAINKNQDSEAKARLHLAKAKIYNDCQVYKKAWDSAIIGKNIKAALSPFNQENFSSHVNKIIEFYSVNGENSGTSNNINRPICIVGMPRSGTTLIEQILSTHSEFYPGGETPALDNALFQQFKGELYLDHQTAINSERLNAMADDYESFFSRFSNFSGNRIIDKIPMHFLHIGLYLQMFPQAKIINFERNKYDVSTSILFENFNLRQNFTHKISDVFCVYQAYQKLMAFWQDKYPNAILTIKYQDFVTQHDKSKQQILDFVGITTASELDYKSSRNAIETPSVWQARQKIYNTSVDRWKHYPQMVDIVSKDQS